MAIATALNFNTAFNFQVDPKKYNLTDITNYPLEGITLNNVRGMFKITDPTGTVVYENSGFATDDFSVPDIVGDTSLEFNTVDLPLDSNGDVIKGNHKINYKIEILGATQPGIYSRENTYSYSFDTPCLKLDVSYDCEDATVTSVDVTDYGPYMTAITRKHNLYPPAGATGLTPTLSALATVVATPISTKTWSAQLESDVTFVVEGGLILYYTLEGTAEIKVDCGVATCDLAKCLYELKEKYDDLKCKNSTKAEKAFKDLQIALATYNLYKAALSCGNIEQAEVYRKEIFSCACDAGCSSCTGCDDDCSGCSTCSELPVIINPGSVTTIPGPSGPQGPAGPQGSVWYNGSGAPLNILGVDGDYYLDNVTYDYYYKSGGTWSLTGNLQGPAGANGADGADGTNGTAFEYFDENAIDHSWTDGVYTLVPGMTHNASVDGNFEVHIHMINTYLDNATGNIELRVNGVPVMRWGPAIPAGITAVYYNQSFVWRGAVSSGQAISVHVEKTGAPAISTKNFSWLINKSQ